MRTRKKLAIGVGLVTLVIVGMVLTDWWMTPAWPPLRVGMGEKEVEQELGAFGQAAHGWSAPVPDSPVRIVTYCNLNDFNKKGFDPDTLNVYFDKNDRVVKWERFDESNGRTPPSLLDQAKRRIRW